MKIYLSLLVTLIVFVTPVNAAYVNPADISPSDLQWLKNALSSNVGLDASIMRTTSGSMVTAMGKVIPLPANWSAPIPRATLAQAAAKVLKKAGPYGIAAYGLYELLSPLIGLNSDGTVTDSNNKTNTGLGSCDNKAGAVRSSTLSGCLPASDPDHSYYWQYDSSSYPGRVWRLYWKNATGSIGYNGGNWVADDATLTTNSPPVNVSESDLVTKIQQSSATSSDLFDKTLNDSIMEGLTNNDVGLVPASNPSNISASPVVGPSEVVKTDHVNNPDGTTSTVETQEQTTAIPQVSGSTVADQKLDWNVETKTTKKTTNDVTGAVQTETSTVTTQTQKPLDLSKLNQESTQQQIKTLLDPKIAPDVSTLGAQEDAKYDPVITEVRNYSTDLTTPPTANLVIPQYWSFADGTCYPAEFDAGRFGKVSFLSFCKIYDDHIRSLIVFMFGVWSVLHCFSYWSEVIRKDL